VAGTLGKPKSPEEDTVARKASLKRCAANALKGAFLLSRKIHSSLLEYTEP